MKNEAEQSPAPVHLVMYGRGGCHLCDDMWMALEAMHSELDFSLEFRDIDSNPGRREKYALKIPVLLSAGSEICHYYLDPVALNAHFSGQLI